jgi:two-component system, LytTR family, sensor histidine kinase AlgZ
VASIDQNAPAGGLPDFCNLGVLLRILVVVHALALGAALLRAPSLAAAGDELIALSGTLQPVLAATLLALAALSGVLKRLPYRAGAVAVVVVATALCALLEAWMAGDPAEAQAPSGRHAALAALTAVMLLAYFDLRVRALSPALAEARLQALQARIRPHFLYNSINAVLSLIRQDPQRAETALEDLADLFRFAMADNRELVRLEREVELCRQYLALEQLRLGARLRVVWRIDKMPRDALIPPLVLQPLLENAVCHGVEPRSDPGEVSIDIYAARGRLHAVVRNPYVSRHERPGGNRMAVANIRERLQLHFDAEATLEIRVREDTYQVHIALPYVKVAAA